MDEANPSVIKRRRSYVLAWGEGGTNVPYGGVGPRADGTQNHGYKPLGSNPDLITEIPELAQHPAFRSLIEFLNAATPFETYGCETLAQPFDGGAGESAPSRTMSSYVNLGLKDRSANTRNNIVDLATDLGTLIDNREMPWVQFELEVEPGRIDGRDSYMLLIRTLGYGVDLLQAYRIWAAAQAWMLATFVELMQGWPGRPEEAEPDA